jgi:hypothetical protein
MNRLLCTLILAGCAGAPVSPIAPPVPTEFGAAGSTVMAKRQPDAQRIRVPMDAVWLLDPIAVSYVGLPAKTVLSQILPTGRVRFDGLDAGPMIARPQHARSRLEHLNAICAQANWAWHTANGVIVISSVATRSFEINIAPGQSTGRVGFGGLGNGGSEDEIHNTEFVADAYASLLTAVKTLTGAAEGSGLVPETGLQVEASVAPEAGLLWVKAPPDMMSRIESLVEDFNKRVNRRVSIEYVLYEVDVTESENRGLDVKALREAAFSGGFDFLGSSFNAGTTGELSLRFDGDNSVDRASVILGWLRGLGNAEMSVRKKVVAQHNQITSLRDVETLRYIESVTIDRQVSGIFLDKQTTVETAQLNTGESWVVLPNIGRDRVYLRLAMTQAALIGIDAYEYDDGNISGRLPQSAETDLGFPISLFDGETRIITNLSSTRAQTNENGMPLLSWLPFVKSRNHSERRIESAVAITARIL